MGGLAIHLEAVQIIYFLNCPMIKEVINSKLSGSIGNRWFKCKMISGINAKSFPTSHRYYLALLTKGRGNIYTTA